MQTQPPTFLSRITQVTDLFAWPLKTSHYLELVNPLWTTHALQARVEKVWDETKDARTVSLLTSEIQQIESARMDKTVTIPSRPSKREVLDAAGGDEQRAAQVERKLDELYGAEA